VLEGGYEREADRLAFNRHLGRIPNELRGNRFEPGGLDSRVQVRFQRFHGRAKIHRPDPTLLVVQCVDADVGRDAIEPRLDGRPAFKTIAVAPGADEGVLHCILGIERRPEHAVAVRRQGRSMLLELGQRGRGQRGVRHSADCREGR
jgi:hypothetical protein